MASPKPCTLGSSDRDVVHDGSRYGGRWRTWRAQQPCLLTDQRVASGGKGANLRGVRRWRMLMMRMIFVLCALCFRIGTWGRVHGNLQQNLTLIGWFKLYSNYSYSLWVSGKKWKKLEVKQGPSFVLFCWKPARFGSSFFCYVLAYCGHWRAVCLGFLAWNLNARDDGWMYFPQFLELFGSPGSVKTLGPLVWSDNGFKRGWAKHQPWQFIWWVYYFPIWILIFQVSTYECLKHPSRQAQDELFRKAPLSQTKNLQTFDLQANDFGQTKGAPVFGWDSVSWLKQRRLGGCVWYEGFHQGAYEFLFGERERQICMVTWEEAMHQISKVSEGFLTNTFFFSEFWMIIGVPKWQAKCPVWVPMLLPKQSDNPFLWSKKNILQKTHTFFEVLWSATSQAMVEMGENFGEVFFEKSWKSSRCFFFLIPSEKKHMKRFFQDFFSEVWLQGSGINPLQSFFPTNFVNMFPWLTRVGVGKDP